MGFKTNEKTNALLNVAVTALVLVGTLHGFLFADGSTATPNATTLADRSEGQAIEVAAELLDAQLEHPVVGHPPVDERQRHDRGAALDLAHRTEQQPALEGVGGLIEEAPHATARHGVAEVCAPLASHPEDAAAEPGPVLARRSPNQCRRRRAWTSARYRRCHPR